MELKRCGGWDGAGAEGLAPGLQEGVVEVRDVEITIRGRAGISWDHANDVESGK